MLLNDLKQSILVKTHSKIRPVIKSKHTATYFTITLSLFCLSIFGMFAIRPTLITAVSLVKEVNDLKNLNLDYENKISNIINAQGEYERVRDVIPFIDIAIPQNAEFPRLARGFESSALANDINLSQLQIDSAPISDMGAKNVLAKYKFIMIGSGNYQAVKDFTSDILTWQRLVTINSMDFSVEGGTLSGILRMTMKGTAYYEP